VKEYIIIRGLIYLFNNQKPVTPFVFLMGVFAVSLIFVLLDNIRRRRMTKVIVKAQEQLQNLMDDIPGGISIFEIAGDKIRNLYFNDGLCELFHYSTQEMEALYTQENCFQIHQDDWNETLVKVKECKETNTIVNLVFRRRLKEGNYRWTHLKTKLVNKSESRNLFYGIYADVNQEKESELQAKVERQKFQIALDNMKLDIWEYDIVNKRAIQSTVCTYLLDYPRVIENFPDCIIESGKLDKNSVEIYRTLHNKVKEGSASVMGEVQIRNSKEKFVWYRLKYITIFDDFDQPIKAIGISEDISVQEKYKEELIKLQEICNYTVQNEYLDVFKINLEKNNIRMFFENGKSIGYIHHQTYESLYQKYLQKIADVDRPIFEEQFKLNNLVDRLEKNNGSLVCNLRYWDNMELKFAECKCAYFRNSKDTILVLISDISQLLLSEKRAKDALAEALEQAKEAAKAKEDFLSYMSHEIRTPLNGIKGMLDLLQQKEAFKEEPYLKDAITSARHLSGLINDILDMQRIDSKKLTLQKVYTEKDEVVHYLEAIIGPMAKEKGITFTQEHINQKYDGIYIDKGRLQQILINLLSNAVKYTNNGGYVTLKVKDKKMGKNRLCITFTVEDNGLGMSKEFLQRAYEPFEQADHSFNVKGSGLGLSITKKLVEAMNGEIHIESELGKGTKVTFMLTVDAVNKEQLRNKDSAKVAALKEHTTFENIHALLVDDNEINREIAKILLESMGVIVETCTNGEEAVNRMKHQKERTFDIIFMDIMMPTMDGLTAAKEIRKLERSDANKIPIVAMTANAFADDVHKSLESGMNYHLSKPFEKEQMRRILIQEFL